MDGLDGLDLIDYLLFQRVEEIKNKRQSHFIFQRMKLAKKIQKAKDIKEVERDLALIKSPAAGLKRINRVGSVAAIFNAKFVYLLQISLHN